ncbi:asparagine synthetase B, partial [candidate division WOR-3 bacterium]|nr:asparagine synthetase B [candidate division WOR-3 bacterium]
KFDPVPTMLVQNHTSVVKEFLGQCSGFRRTTVKPAMVILGEVHGTEEIKYLHGNYGKGTFTYLAGHDPEDYQHFVGDPPTDLRQYRNSPGYRLILNNVLFPAARKKELKT